MADTHTRSFPDAEVVPGSRSLRCDRCWRTLSHLSPDPNAGPAHFRYEPDWATYFLDDERVVCQDCLSHDPDYQDTLPSGSVARLLDEDWPHAILVSKYVLPSQKAVWLYRCYREYQAAAEHRAKQHDASVGTLHAALAARNKLLKGLLSDVRRADALGSDSLAAALRQHLAKFADDWAELLDDGDGTVLDTVPTTAKRQSESESECSHGS